MKRRGLSFILALALCLNLCPVWVSAAYESGPCEHHTEHTDDCGYDEATGTCKFVCEICTNANPSSPDDTLTGDVDNTAPFVVDEPMTLNTNGFTLTGMESTAIQITATGSLVLKGHVVAKQGSGVEVQSGGSLRIEDPGTSIKGKDHALYVESGATVVLAGGKYTTGTTGLAILIKNGSDSDYAALLAPGYAFFGESGNQLAPADVATVQTVTVAQCTSHPGKTYVPNTGTPTHTWTCPQCRTSGTEKCTFSFDQSVTGSCVCGHELTITVDETKLGTLEFTDTVKPADNGIVTATLDDGTVLGPDDYAVTYRTRAEAGSTDFTVTVMVDGNAYEGHFENSYPVTTEVLQWKTPGPVTVPYTGSAVTKDDLPGVQINIKSSEDLNKYLQYSYRQGNAAYTDGLPTNAGTYEVVVTLPEEPVNLPDYQAASSKPITLIIEPINPIVEAPKASMPVFNRTAQELVTAGELAPVAIADGLTIEFATEENGTYSTDIPTETNAGSYTVWYKVVGLTDNYTEPKSNPAEITGVKIQRKSITPVVTLSDYTYLYDGGEKQPTVTVKDDDRVTDLPDTEYKVEYVNNRNVSTDTNPAKVVVSDKIKNGGNYDITQVEVEFKITLREQAALSITNQPNTVTYGDQFTLGTSGGSGNGIVTWKITSGMGVATVDQNSGEVTVIGDGSATVQATKSGTDPATNVVNYEDATATWTLTAKKKPVTATVTAEDKSYNGDPDATVHAVVESGVLPGDVITITGLTGTFSDENAGADKTVTVVTTDAKITGTNSEHYTVTYSATTVKAAIHKAVANIESVTGAKDLVYNGTEQALITGAQVDPNTVLVEYALSEDGPYSTDFPKGTNAGTYTVWYRVQETNNYTGLAPDSVDVTIIQKPVSPTVELSGEGLQTDNSATPPTYSYVYDGTAKEPAVTLYEADGTTVIPTGEYTVAYSGNVNVGTATVTVTAKADGNYSFTAVTKNFAITEKQAQVLTAPEAAGLPLTFTNYAQRLVTAGVAEGGTMVYSVGDQNGTYSAIIPSETKAGTYTVYYKVQGDGNHSDSGVGSVTVTIAPKTVKDPTIELFDENDNPLVSYTYDGTAKTPKVVVKDSSTVIAASEYNIVYSDNTDAGKATVNITDKLNGNYAVTGSTTFVINKANIVDPDPKAATLTYNGTAQELLVPGTTSGGTVLYALNSATSTFTDAIPTGVNAVTYNVYYKVVGDKNHNDLAVQGPVAVTIGRKPLTTPIIELTPDAFEYDGKAHLPTVTVKDGETVVPESEYTWACYGPDDATAAVTDPITAGTYTITVSDKTGGNYDLTGANPNTATFIIGKAAQEKLVIEGKPEQVYYGDSFQLTTSGGSGGGKVTWKIVPTDPDDPAVVGETVEAESVPVTITGVGEVTINVVKDGDTNYAQTSTQWTFTAAPKPVTAEVTVTAKNYDGTTDIDNVNNITATVNGLVGSDSVTLSGLTGTYDNANAGTGKTVTLTGGTVGGTHADKYDVTIPTTVTGDINPRAVTVAVTLSDYDLQGNANDGYYYEYDGTVKTPTVTVKGTDGAYSATLADGDYSVSVTGNKNVGDATVTVTAKADGNYTFTTASVQFAIRKAAAVLTSSPQAKDLTYEKGKEQELVAVGTATGGTVVYALKTGDAEPGDTSYSENIPKGENAGTYTVYYKVQGDANHESTAPSQMSATIKPKEITPTITLSGSGLTETNGIYSYTYDGAAKTPTVTVKDDNDEIPGPNADKPEYSVSYRDNVNAGTATVVISDANGGNYIVNGTASFEITKAAPTFTAPTGKNSLQYNGELQELVTAGGSSNGTVVYSVNGGNYSSAIPTASAVGEYKIKYMVKGDANHSDTVPADLSVEIAQNTVTNPTIHVEPASVKYTGEKQTPTVTVKDDAGLLIDGSEYEVAYADTTNSNNNDLIQVGTYTVTVTGVTDENGNANGNYTFNTTKTATFTITPADQTALTITGIRERVYYGDTIPLGTTGGTSGGTVTWDVGGSTIASIDTTNGLLKITGVGSVMVTATSTDGNYKPQTAAWNLYADKKPVTALVTAASKTYDGDADATVTATLQTSDFVDTDSFTITLTGCTFEDPNAGTDKKVNVDSTNPAFTVSPDPDSTDNHEKYAITYPATATASIFKADVTSVTAPEAATGLTYTGLPQELVKTAGSATDGTMEYSTDGINYSASIPTGTDAGNYDVWYRVKGDGNHNDTAGTKLTDSTKVNIAKQTVDAPTIEFNPSGATYDGQEHKPAVIVKDNNNRVIPAEEYTVGYGTTDWKTASSAVVKHMVTIADETGGNYELATKSAEFTISMMGQNPLSITNQPGEVRYGDSFTLSTTGGSGTGAVTWTSSDTSVATIGVNGLVKTLKSGSTTITATKQADANYGAVSVTWALSVEKKPVTAIVTANGKVYDGKDTATLIISWTPGDVLSADVNTLTTALESALSGKFNSADAGENKTVMITGTAPNNDRYTVTFNTTTTASITAQAATLSGSTPTTLTYSGSAQDLVTGITATNGEVAYSTDGSYYTLLAPTGTNAGTYPVWYKAQGSGNYKDSSPVRLNVTIQPKTVNNPVIELSPDTFDYDGMPKKPDVVVKDGNNVIPAGEYTVSYSNNINVGTDTAKVTISDNTGGNYTVSGSKTFTIAAGKATLTTAPQAKVLTYTGAAQELVSRGAAANGTVVYSQTETGSYTTTIPRQTNAGSYEVWYKVRNIDGTDATSPQYLPVTIARKTITAEVLLDSEGFTYSGNPCEPEVLVMDLDDSNFLIQDADYTVRYMSNTKVGTAKVIVMGKGNYSFSVITTFEIVAANAEFETKPEAIPDLKYNGTAQALVSAGSAKNSGIVLYSLDGASFSTVIPTAINRGSYTVYAKVQGSSNYEESDVVPVSVEIGVNTLSADDLTVTLSASNFPYTGGEVKPTVTVTDRDGNVISADEYTVTYSDNVNVGKAKVSIKSKTTSNYSFTASTEFQIVDVDQTPLTITGKKDTVYYGDTLGLGTTGGGSGTVTWNATGPVDKLGDGQYKVNSSGSVTITATKGSSTDTWMFYAQAKPVTATVHAANKVYDGNTNATLTVTLSGLLPGESVTSVTAQGQFSDANVGTNKTVTITSLTIPDEVDKLYAISHSGTNTASITPAPAAVTAAPTLATGSLTYNGGAQPLLANDGTAASGNLMYSLDGKDYSYTAPTGTDAKTYTVWYKVEAADENHKDSAAAKLGNVTIRANVDAPSVLCTPSTVQYDGTEKTPTVVVRDSQQRIIPESEYTVTLPANRIAVGTYTVTVTDKAGGNYNFTDPVTGTFQIVTADQNPLSIVTDIPTGVHYGDTFRLSAMGGSGSGAIQWSIAESSVATINTNGVVTVTGTGGFTVEAYRAAAGGYSDSNTDSVPFDAKPKPVTPVVTASDKSYDGKTDATLTASWKNGDLVSGDTITITATGTFATADAGTNKRVSVIGNATGTDTTLAKKYAITWPESTTASIYKVDAKLSTAPAGADLTYNGSAQALVTDGATENNIGTVVYSTSQNGAYSETIPTGINAGKYTVWYKVADSVNYTGVAPAAIEVEIKKATPTIGTNPTATGTAGQKLKDIKFTNGGAASVPGKFAWESPETEAVAGTAYNVIFTPTDTANYNTVTIQVQAVSAPSGTSDSGTNSAPMRTTVRDGAANTVLSAAGGNKLVREAVKNQSDSIVIKPEITGDVAKTAVSIPASTVSRINSETDAALTVSTPIADATIPNAALETLSSAGTAVKVTTEQVGDAVTLTLAAGGETLDDIPVTLSVPVENAGPGTVAVLVNEDGTRETIRKSVVEDGAVNIPLNGSATVEIVDNSKEFADVSNTDWEADAVAFASAHELFSGTSETTFSPDQAMSRGMLATVLYNLEGRPEQDLTMGDLDGYSDVSNDAWYAGGVAWAAENGIASGYGDGQFGPDDSVTREQFVVMLWKYAGSPKAGGQSLDFTDADQVSGYAQEALCWAVEKGILSGFGDGQLAPGGTATRAQAAQILKNFMERA